MARYLSFLLLLAAHSVLFAQEPHPLAGEWRGEITIPGSPLRVSVKLKHSDQTWSGTIDIPVQQVKDLPLHSFDVKDRRALFMISEVPGKATFDGEVSEDGSTFSGDYRQAGAALKFKLTNSRVEIAEKKIQEQKHLSDLESLVAGVLKTFDAPSCAVAVVRGDGPILVGGFGKRDVEADLPATEDTVYAIGSSTKAFTTFLIARLVDEGKLAWTDNLRDLHPGLKFDASSSTQDLTLRDAVTHRSGMPRHDLVWYGRPHFSAAELFGFLEHLEFTAPVRTNFQYNNLMYATAGFVAAEKAGSTYGEALKKYIFEPLGMDNTTADIAGFERASEPARPYAMIRDKMTQIKVRPVDAVAPAGSINASARDMARWVQFHLSRGKMTKEPLLSPEKHKDLFSPVIPFGADGAEAEVRDPTYAHGWMRENYRGKVHIHHGGNIDGFSALVSFFPENDIGFVVLTNSDGSPVPEVISRTLADRFLGLEAIDWQTRKKSTIDLAKTIVKSAETSLNLERVKDTRWSRPTQMYVGEYAHPAYGVLQVSVKVEETLEFSWNGIPLTAEHWHYDTFRIGFADPGANDIKFLATFQFSADGDVRAIESSIDPTTSPIVFESRGGADLLSPEYLDRFTGSYTFKNTDQSAIVSRNGKKLMMKIAGQQTRELVPFKINSFHLTGLTGFTMKFVVDPSGAVTGVRSVQPNGVFEATRNSAAQSRSN